MLENIVAVLPYFLFYAFALVGLIAVGTFVVWLQDYIDNSYEECDEWYYDKDGARHHRSIRPKTKN